MSNRQYAILVVDDVRLDREILRKFLQNEGHCVTCVEDGLEALEMLEAQVFDLVVLDIMMPRLYGTKVLQKIRANPRFSHIPVIIMTSIHDTESAARCIELGADDYLTKPHNKTLLRARINNCMRRIERRYLEKMILNELEEEKKRSESLLFSIMPKAIVDRLKRGPRSIVDYVAEVTVMFSDIVGYTKLSSSLPEEEVVQLLHAIFSSFDELAMKHRLEKIKTIGDSYMVVGGIPDLIDHHAEAIAEMALEMKAMLHQLETSRGDPISMRFGIHTGPVQVGIIGKHKFSYDLWGDTVNLASRMESCGIPGQIQVTEATYHLLKDRFILEKRDAAVNVKGKGVMSTYFLLGRKAPIKGTAHGATVLMYP